MSSFICLIILGFISHALGQLVTTGFPKTNCGFSGSHPDRRIMDFLAREDNEPGHPSGIQTRLSQWIPSLSDGSPHPNLDTLIRNGAGPVPNNHPNMDTICQIRMPVLAISGIHPSIEEALIIGTPLPAVHPSVHSILSHAMTTDHPNIDELMQDPAKWVYPQFHPPISPWLHRWPIYDNEPPSAQCQQAFDATLLSLHTSPDDCFIVFGAEVWDVSTYVARHAGGGTLLNLYCGSNGTDGFNNAAHVMRPFQNALGHATCVGTVPSGIVIEPPGPPPTEPPSMECLAEFDTSQLGDHVTENDCYIVFGSRVWDFSGYAALHPGGAQSLLTSCGSNGTSSFNAASHTFKPFANAMGAGTCVGTVPAGTSVAEPTQSPPKDIVGNLFQDGGFSVSWQVLEDAGEILFTMTAKASGWISLGISTAKSMTDMDCYTGFLDPLTGEPVIIDAYSVNSKDPPLYDDDGTLKGEQSALVLEGFSENGVLSITFKRALVTGDIKGKDQDIGDFELYLIWGYSDGSYNAIHSAYGVSPLINLLTGEVLKGLSAGQWLVVFLASSILLMTLIKLTDKYLKYRKKKKNMSTSAKVSVSLSRESSAVTHKSVIAGTANVLRDPNKSLRTFGITELPDETRACFVIEPLSSKGFSINSGTVVREVGAKDKAPYASNGDKYASSDIDPEIVRVDGEEIQRRGPWIERWDAANQHSYWYNEVSGISQWEPPENSEIMSKRMPPKPPVEDARGQDRSVVANEYMSRDWTIHDSFERNKLHKGEDLYEYEACYKPRARLNRWGTFVHHQPVDQKTKDEPGEAKPEADEYFSDADLSRKKSTIFYACRNLLQNTRVLGHWSLSHVMFALGYILVNALCLYLTPQRPLDLANGFGSLAAANAMFLIIPATRNNVLTWLLGLPFDHVILYHRLLGRIAIGCSFVHFCYYFIPWTENSSPKYLYGFFAMFCGLVIFFSSLDTMRRKHFEIFYWAHYSYFGFFTFGYFHVPQCKPFLLAGTAIYGIDKILRAVWTLFPTRLLVFKNKGDKIAHVRFPKNVSTEWFGKHKIGQYYFVNFPALSLTEWHPFSVSSGPRELDVELHIRNLGDHTSKIVDFAQRTAALAVEQPARKLPWIRIDGPYGNLDFNIRRYGILILCGGGVGVTPVMGIMKDLYNGGNLDPSRREVVVPHRIKEVLVCWVVPHAIDYEVFRADIEECMEHAQHPQFPKLRVMVYASRAKAEEAVEPILTGRPKFGLLFDQIEKNHPSTSTLVFACGPDAMVNELWDLSTKKSLQGRRIDFHHETFNF